MMKVPSLILYDENYLMKSMETENNGFTRRAAGDILCFICVPLLTGWKIGVKFKIRGKILNEPPRSKLRGIRPVMD